MDELSELFRRIAVEIAAGFETELCTKCHKAPRRPGQRWCRECAAAYMRAWRRRKSRLCPVCREVA